MQYIQCLTNAKLFVFRWFYLMNIGCVVWCLIVLGLPDTNGSCMSSKRILSYFTDSHIPKNM